MMKKCELCGLNTKNVSSHLEYRSIIDDLIEYKCLYKWIQLFKHDINVYFIIAKNSVLIWKHGWLYIF